MRALLVTGVLGLGTALVFVAAAVTAALFPTGPTVGAGWNGGWVDGKGGMVMPLPEPVPVMIEGDVAVPDPRFDALPGDTVPAGDGGVILEAVPER